MSPRPLRYNRPVSREERRSPTSTLSHQPADLDAIGVNLLVERVRELGVVALPCLHVVEVQGLPGESCHELDCVLKGQQRLALERLHVSLELGAALGLPEVNLPTQGALIATLLIASREHVAAQRGQQRCPGHDPLGHQRGVHAMGSRPFDDVEGRQVVHALVGLDAHRHHPGGPSLVSDSLRGLQLGRTSPR